MEIIHVLAIVSVGIFAETSYLVAKSVQPARVKQAILLDTSVLIDGRIIAIARSGLISAKLIVPRSVVRELQFMADKADHDKRERARYGLDVIEQLQAIDTVSLEVIDDGTTSERGVDEQLMNLAKQWSARLCTIDYNLNKSARVQGIQVININELAHALRTTYLPGEKLEVKLQQAGQENHQAVGYLDDGTMVVVDNAKQYIGQQLTVEATRVLQTVAGKMMFARHHERPMRLKPVKQQPPSPRKVSPSQQTKPQRQPQPQPQRSKSNVRRPRTPEESLVNLANK